MLPSGIYEQLVNTKISTELSKLDPEQYDIQLESLEAEDARRILTIYISYVIQQGLHYIRDSYPVSRDRESLIAQINCVTILSQKWQCTQMNLILRTIRSLKKVRF
jgi:hypothetical protein